jgi:hypothetical protein
MIKRKLKMLKKKLKHEKNIITETQHIVCSTASLPGTLINPVPTMAPPPMAQQFSSPGSLTF